MYFINCLKQTITFNQLININQFEKSPIKNLNRLYSFYGEKDL